MHYYPAYTIEDVERLSVRQLNIMVKEVGKVHLIFNPPLDSDKKATEQDIENAEHLGCTNPEALR